MARTQCSTLAYYATTITREVTARATILAQDALRADADGLGTPVGALPMVLREDAEALATALEMLAARLRVSISAT